MPEKTSLIGYFVFTNQRPLTSLLVEEKNLLSLTFGLSKINYFFNIPFLKSLYLMKYKDQLIEAENAKLFTGSLTRFFLLSS